MRAYNLQQSRPIKVGPYTTSKIELIDLLKAWAAISVAFAILQVGLTFSLSFVIVALLSALTVGIAFILHELAHKIAAQRYGCFAEFRAKDSMLFLAILM
jgi:fatty acid desaturase